MNRKARRAAQFGNSLTSGFNYTRQIYLDHVAMEKAAALEAFGVFLQHQLDNTVYDAMDKETREIELHQYPVLAH